MSDSTGDFSVGLTIGLGVAFIAVIMTIAIAGTYKDGLIDAINGKVKYSLVTKSDGSTSWDRVTDGKEPMR